MTAARVIMAKAAQPARRLGGELPEGCDARALVPWALPHDVFAFSHGRAALAWLHAARGPFAAVLHCAYTCPSVPRFLGGLGLALAQFDAGAREDEVLALARAPPRPLLVLVPALFGADPWLKAGALAQALGEDACVVIDAAQSAFGALDYAAPKGGAVLSCPRKALALSDGALLRLDGATDRERAAVAALPEANEAARLKREARALFAIGNSADEAAALALNTRAELTLPDRPHRMSDEALGALLNIDAAVHRARRRANAALLRELLGAAIRPVLGTGGVPFNFPVLIEGRDAALRRLHARRLFATPLWPDAVHDAARHPRAHEMANQLIALPIDQRYGEAEITRIAEIARAWF